MIRPLLAAAFIVTTAAHPLAAQSSGIDDNARREVLAVVRRLFDGMRAQDSAMARATMHPSATLISAVHPAGKAPVIQVDSVDAFQLAKDADGWKIISIADTRRRAGCAEIPKG